MTLPFFERKNQNLKFKVYKVDLEVTNITSYEVQEVELQFKITSLAFNKLEFLMLYERIIKLMLQYMYYMRVVGTAYTFWFAVFTD